MRNLRLGVDGEPPLVVLEHGRQHLAAAAPPISASIVASTAPGLRTAAPLGVLKRAARAAPPKEIARRHGGSGARPPACAGAATAVCLRSVGFELC